MLNHQWVTVLKQAAMAAGWDATNLGALSYNSMRRFLPTMANVLRFSENTAQAIGSWQEHPQGEGGSASTSRQLMSVHYSDQRALASAEAKRDVLSLFFRLVQHHAETCSASSSSGQPYSLTWEQLANLNHTHQHHPSPAPPDVLAHQIVIPPSQSPASPPAKRAAGTEKDNQKEKKKEDKKSGRKEKGKGKDKHRR